MRKLTKRLVAKSKIAFLLALELYNKPTINYRTESFCIFFTNAWELLLKGYIFEKNGGKITSIFYPKKRNQKRMSLTIDDCLDRTFINVNDPVKKNIEYVSELRNESTHLILEELDPYHSRAFQVGVFNYALQLKEWFSISLDREVGPGLISLITDVNKIPNIEELRSKYSKRDFTELLEWIRKYEELAKLGNKGALSVEYKIKIVKSDKNADFVISSGPSGQQGATVIEKFRNPDETHPYSATEAIKEIQIRSPKNLTFSSYIFQSYLFVNGLKNDLNNSYYIKLKHSGAGQYSQKLVDELVQALVSNRQSIKNWTTQYSRHLNQIRKSR